MQVDFILRAIVRVVWIMGLMRMAGDLAKMLQNTFLNISVATSMSRLWH